MTERVVLGVTGPADRLLAAGLDDLRGPLAELRGHVVVVGGLMARTWLHARPVEGIPPRATADVDLGIDRKGLRLTSTSKKIGPLLEARNYEPLPGDEGFRFRKNFGDGQALLIDLFIAKGASRDEPAVLESGIPTLAAPGLAYALSREPFFVDLLLVDGDMTTDVELPLPTLDAAFVLKAALCASGLRTRPDRVQRDRVDAVMLAAACLQDDAALAALRQAPSNEARVAIRWIESRVDQSESAVARTLERYLAEEHGISGGGEWAVGIARNLSAKMMRT